MKIGQEATAVPAGKKAPEECDELTDVRIIRNEEQRVTALTARIDGMGPDTVTFDVPLGTIENENGHLSGQVRWKDSRTFTFHSKPSADGIKGFIL